MFTALWTKAGPDSEDPVQFAGLAGRFIREWEALAAVLDLWTGSRPAHPDQAPPLGGPDWIDSDALTAAAGRAAAELRGPRVGVGGAVGAGPPVGGGAKFFRVVQNRSEVASIVSHAFMSLRQVSHALMSFPSHASFSSPRLSFPVFFPTSFVSLLHFPPTAFSRVSSILSFIPSNPSLTVTLTSVL